MKKFISLILAGIIAAGTVMAVSAEETAPERAKGVVFKAETGIVASTYTGTACGFTPGDTVGYLTESLENSLGIEVTREGVALGADKALACGDKVVLTAEDGTVKSEFVVMFMGDVNSDSKTNLGDVSLMMKKIAKWDVTIDDMAADVNGDGVLNLGDISHFLKIIAKWDVRFAYPVFPGKVEMKPKREANCYGNPGSQGWSPVCLSDGIHYDLGVKFNVAEGEYATQISFLCPSWGDNKGEMSISVYKWDGDYKSSIAAMPIVTHRFVDYVDNSMIFLDLTDSSGKGLAEGEYVWRIHDGVDTEGKTGVGIWFFEKLAPAESTGMKTFLNQKEFNIGPVSTIYISKAK